MPLNLFADTTEDENNPLSGATDHRDYQRIFLDSEEETGQQDVKMTWDTKTQSAWMNGIEYSEEEYLATLPYDAQREHYTSLQHNGTYNPQSRNPLYAPSPSLSPLAHGGTTGMADSAQLDVYDTKWMVGGEGTYGSPSGQAGTYSHTALATESPANKEARIASWETWYSLQPESVRLADTAAEFNFRPTETDPHTGKLWTTRNAAPFGPQFKSWFEWKSAQENDWPLWEDKDIKGVTVKQVDTMGAITQGDTQDTSLQATTTFSNTDPTDQDRAWLNISGGLENATGHKFPNQIASNAEEVGLTTNVNDYNLVQANYEPITQASSAARRQFWSSPVVKIIQTFAPPVVKLALAVAKETSNQDVSPMEWAGAVMGALQLGGYVDPTAATVGDAGTGIGNMSYADTEALLNAAASDDVEDFVINQFQTEFTDIAMDGLAAVGIDAETFGTDDVTMRDNVGGIVTDWASEGSLTDAVVKNVGEEGVEALVDALPDVDFNLDIDTPEWVEGIGDTIVAGAEALAESPLGQAVGEGAEWVGDVAEEGLQALGDIPVVQEIGEAGQVIVDTTSDVLSEAEDIVVDTAKAAEDFVEPAKDFVADTFEPIVDAADEFIDAVDSPIGDALGYGEDFLKWLAGGAVGAFGAGGAGGGMSSTPTESLFDKELFKFDTQVGLTDTQRIRPKRQMSTQGMFGV